jgi:hypothetical protein
VELTIAPVCVICDFSGCFGRQARKARTYFAISRTPAISRSTSSSDV